MIKLKDILSESPNEIESEFGNIAFGDPSTQWGDSFAKMQGKSATEKNTPTEEYILSLLSKWANDSENVSEKIYAQYGLFKKASKIFPSVFKPETPNGTEIYRGLAFGGNKDFVSQLKKSKSSDYEILNLGESVYYKYKLPINYTPYKPIQSWTADANIADYFAYRRSVKERRLRGKGVVLITKQNDEYLFSQKAMNVLYSISNEKEMLHFGNDYKENIYIALQDRLYVSIVKD
jgi:hypothetical protein